MDRENFTLFAVYSSVTVFTDVLKDRAHMGRQSLVGGGSN